MDHKVKKTTVIHKRHKTEGGDDIYNQNNNSMLGPSNPVVGPIPSPSPSPPPSPSPSPDNGSTFDKGFQPPWWATDQGRQMAGETIGVAKGIWDAGQGARSAYNWISASMASEAAPIAEAVGELGWIAIV
jgi:hypothetical protein